MVCQVPWCYAITIELCGWRVITRFRLHIKGARVYGCRDALCHSLVWRASKKWSQNVNVIRSGIRAPSAMVGEVPALVPVSVILRGHFSGVYRYGDSPQ